MEDVEVIEQLVNSMSEVLEKFEQAYKKEDAVSMKKLKSFLLKLQIEMEEVLHGNA